MKKTFRLYLLDDCESTIFLMKNWLTPEYDVETFKSPETFILRFKESKPDICLLDVNLNQHKNGLDVLKELHQEMSPNIPLIMISQEAPEFRKYDAYKYGAIDYLKKPLDKKSFKLKLTNILRLIDNCITKEERLIILDEQSNSFTLKQEFEKRQTITLTPKEFIIFKQLVTKPNTTIKRCEIQENLESKLNESLPGDRIIDVHVCNIKRKLGASKELIKTVYGLGYQFIPQVY